MSRSEPGGPLRRLMGAEMEYALRVEGDEPAPASGLLYQELREAVGQRVAMRPASGVQRVFRGRVFLQNGGSLYHEAHGTAPEHGLVEAGTPECRGPTALLAWVRAQDRLLADAAAAVSKPDRVVRLRRNGRDPKGRVYGPQENYEVDLASGPALWVWRLFVPWLVLGGAAAGVVHLAVMVVGLLVVGVALLVLLGLSVLVGVGWASATDRAVLALDRTVALLGRVEQAIAVLVHGPPAAMLHVVLSAVGWRPYRRALRAFLATRMIVTGAGSLREDGRFVLSEKAHAVKREMRWTALPDDRGVFETGHLLKAGVHMAFGEWRAGVALFRQRQRLQLGLADAGRCDVSAWLGFGSTALLLDLIEDGALDDAPQLADPIAAMRKVSEEGIDAALPLRDGGSMTALAVQRWYADRASAWVSAQPALSAEAWRVVSRWREVLDALEHDPDSLIGKLDWVTKQALLEDAGADLTWEAQKVIDLRYHELGDGYADWLDEEGLIERIVSEVTVARAVEEPPHDTAAADRGRLIKVGANDPSVSVSWEHVFVAGRRVKLRPWGKAGG